MSFVAERERLIGVTVDFDNAYDRYFPAFEDGICARLSVSASVDEYELKEFA